MQTVIDLEHISVRALRAAAKSLDTTTSTLYRALSLRSASSMTSPASVPSTEAIARK